MTNKTQGFPKIQGEEWTEQQRNDLLNQAYNQVSGIHDILSALLLTDHRDNHVSLQLKNKASIAMQKMERLGATDMEAS